MTGRVGVADRARLAHAARFASLTGLSAGLAAAPFVLAGEPAWVAALGAACACALLAAGSRGSGRLALACGLVGLGAGTPTCWPSASTAARLIASGTAARDAPPARSTASVTREPAGNR